MADITAPPAIAPVRLAGRHIELIPMDASHTDGLYEAGRSPEIWTYMRMQVSSRDDMARLVLQALGERDAGREIPFVIRDRAAQRIVGSTRFLDIRPADRGIEIGWTWLDPAVWRTPVNTESKYLLLRHCFETFGLIRVQLKTDARNVRARRAIERLGAVREGVLRHQFVMPDGYLRDSVYYSILAEEWPAARAHLEGLLLGRGR